MGRVSVVGFCHFFCARECFLHRLRSGEAFLPKLGRAQFCKGGIYTLGGCELVVVFISDACEVLHG